MEQDEIPALLRQIQATGDEEKVAAAREAMYQYREKALARPNEAHVAFLRVRLRTRLQELLGDR